VRPVALANRQLLHRVVRHLLKQGVRQFVDIGSGVPTMGNVHHVADELVPDSRVVYVDNEPVAVAHSHELLRKHGDPQRHAIVNADLRAPDPLWQRVRRTSRSRTARTTGRIPGVRPGMCWAPEWHPDEAMEGADTDLFDDPSESVVWTGVAYKPV
jgi:hypothetical protein